MRKPLLLILLACTLFLVPWGDVMAQDKEYQLKIDPTSKQPFWSYTDFISDVENHWIPAYRKIIEKDGTKIGGSSRAFECYVEDETRATLEKLGKKIIGERIQPCD